MNKFLKNFTTVAIGASLGGLLAGAGVLIYKMASTKDEPYHRNPSSQRDFNKEMKIDYMPLIKEYNFKDTNKPFLGENGMRKLAHRIRDDLGFGPEIYGLKSISLSPGYIIGEGNNGVFFPGTNEIFINSSNIRDMATKNASMDLKVELVFQILVHEYGHYIASQYVETAIDPENTADIYDLTRENKKIKGHWNMKFSNEFKKLLHYSGNTTHYTHKEVLDGEKKWNTLSSQLNAQELFEKANGPLNAVYNLKPDTAFIGKIIANKPFLLDSTKLKYLYSMSELFTRRYQLLSYIPKSVSPLNADGWIAKNSASPFLSDILSIQSGLVNTTSVRKETFRYMKDSPFSLDVKGNSTIGVSLDMYNALLQQFGTSNGADISVIYPENNSWMKNAKYMELSGNSKRIKIGGYIPSTDNYNQIGYLKNNHFVKIDSLSVGKFTYKHRDSFRLKSFKNDLSKLKNKLPNSETKFYITKHYNLGSKFVNHELYLSNGKTQMKLQTTRVGNLVGKTASYRPYFPSRLGKTYYEAVDDAKMGLRIKERQWT